MANRVLELIHIQKGEPHSLLRMRSSKGSSSKEHGGHAFTRLHTCTCSMHSPTHIPHAHTPCTHPLSMHSPARTCAHAPCIHPLAHVHTLHALTHSNTTCTCSMHSPTCTHAHVPCTHPLAHVHTLTHVGTSWTSRVAHMGSTSEPAHPSVV